jgi:outer membrane lipoprotein SlyB
MSPELDRLANSNGYIITAMDEVNKMSKNGELAPSWQVVPPMLGFKPNIQYWDVVKRSLDDVIEKASKGELNNSKNVLGGAQAAKTALVKELDTLLPQYGSVRNQAAEMFGVETSLEAGYELGRKAATGSPFDVGEFVTNFRKLSPDQKESFAEGSARFVMQKAKGDMKGLMSYMENPNVNRTMREVMGPDRFDALYAKAVSSNLAATAQDFALTESGNVKKIASLIGEVGGGAIGFGAVPALATLNPASLATIGAATAGALAGIALNASERKVANRVIELAFSTKPEDAKKFSKLLADDYDAVSVSRKLGDYMSSATQKGILAYINNQREAPKPTGSTPGLSLMAPMNTGGRIARKSGGRTMGNSISAEVKRVRALLSEKTASMLSVPDDAIATALHIAKRT